VRKVEQYDFFMVVRDGTKIMLMRP